MRIKHEQRDCVNTFRGCGMCLEDCEFRSRNCRWDNIRARAERPEFIPNAVKQDVYFWRFALKAADVCLYNSQIFTYKLKVGMVDVICCRVLLLLLPWFRSCPDLPVPGTALRGLRQVLSVRSGSLGISEHLWMLLSIPCPFSTSHKLSLHCMWIM